MQRFTVTVEIEADVDGWARASKVNAAAALTEIRTYVRDQADSLVRGQTYLALAKPADVHIDLGLDDVTLD
jgi:hypothetical protein